MSHERENSLLAAVHREISHAGDFYVPLNLDLTGALGIVASLQLSLRLPGNIGPPAVSARAAIEWIISTAKTQGFTAVAELMRMGDDPRNDGSDWKP